MTNKIESGIPIPEKSTRKGRKPKHPFAELKPGESVLVQSEKLRSYAISYAYQSGKKFVTRKQPCGGIRVWRSK